MYLGVADHGLVKI